MPKSKEKKGKKANAEGVHHHLPKSQSNPKVGMSKKRLQQESSPVSEHLPEGL
jgi:hypothetical protein